MAKSLGDFEKLILFALLRLGDEAYGAAIQREITSRTGREVAIGAVYTGLHRLQKHGLITARMGEPTAERGGRRKKYYTLEPAGARALDEAYEMLRRMAEGTGARLEALTEAGDV
jgi:DNA-binding PadR family transcriptional regulator